MEKERKIKQNSFLTARFSGFKCSRIPISPFPPLELSWPLEPQQQATSNQPPFPAHITGPYTQQLKFLLWKAWKVWITVPWKIGNYCTHTQLLEQQIPVHIPILKRAFIQTGASIPKNSFDQYRRTFKVASNQVTSRMASTTLTTTPSLQPTGPFLQPTGPSLQQDGLPYHAPQEAGQVEQPATGDFPGLDL